MSRLVDLDDPACADGRHVGAKAAALARLRAHGLPVLPGVVVPVEECTAVFRRAVKALREGGSGAARLEVLDAGVEPDLLYDLERAVRRLGEPVVVRSSSPLEGDGVWAGAFSTFHDVTGGEIGTAVRGCWSSAFSVAALERADMAGVDPQTLRLAVLVQRQLACDAGGVAQVLPEGEVEVTAVKGAPEALLSGSEPGVRARVGSAIHGATATRALGAAVLRDVARLARRAHDIGGLDRIEWGAAGAHVTLLQAQRTRSRRPPAAPRAHPALGSATARRVAGVVHRWPGGIAEEHVLPWALALPQLPPGGPSASDRPLEDWRRACGLAAELTRQVWGSPAEARRVLAVLRGPDPAGALGRIASLQPPTLGVASQTVDLFTAVGCALAERGALRAAADLWRCVPSDVEQALARGAEAGTLPCPQRSARWEPFVHAVVSAQGAAVRGTPVVAGIGAGPLRLVRNPHAAPPPAGTRPLLVADRPLPGLAPLLWDAAGLVVGSGNPAAHLLEVASALGVPCVVGVDLEPLTGEPDTLLATVDGRAGVVAVADLQTLV